MEQKTNKGMSVIPRHHWIKFLTKETTPYKLFCTPVSVNLSVFIISLAAAYSN